MFAKETKKQSEISNFLENIISSQSAFEQHLNKTSRKQNGVFFTNSVSTIDNLLDVVEINADIFSKRILEPACGQGIFLLKLISKVYDKFPDEKLISSFIENNLFFVDVNNLMVENTTKNILALYFYLFQEEYQGTFNAINWDFTDKKVINNLFDELPPTPFVELYNSFDYVIGNPPYVTLYGRRDKKENEEQRINYLKNYKQFPDYVKNGKINLVMLFIEHSLDFLNQNGKLSFIIDVSFFETAYEHTRRYLLLQTTINELQVNIKDFNVASGQVILKVTKSKANKENEVTVTDWKTRNTYSILQSSWFNKDDEYKFRYNGCSVAKQIIDKVKNKNDKTILQLFPNKNLRTCVMLLNMEDKFTFCDVADKNEELVFPYYQGSKALSEKYGKLIYSKYFYYNKPLQDKINKQLKQELEKAGIKNKKRIGLGETAIYGNPKVYIRQSAKEIIASIDLNKSSANNSLYVFSLRNNTPETIEFLYFLCGWLNTDLVTYYAQQMNIIRYSQGKQPQIKISDLGTIFIPTDKGLQKQFAELSKQVYESPIIKNELSEKMNYLIGEYYELSQKEIEAIAKAIKDY
ncbi:Eco57I restriction-modification methylase domain-containing protein [Capnocytophaga canis]|uniref:Eco57I restriction-modification methylase domain-containing protein n=1 Tax=Capnocytophaga canis TaxID=1848903 RepID=UPI00156218EA|nr:N-6 DNA methylase [Capnocytophaga canis]